jgi:hypothetical protein
MSIQRVGAIAGIIGVGLFLVGGFSQGVSIPEVDAPPGEITAFFADKQDVLRYALPLLLLAVTATGVFLLGLFDRMRAAGAGTWAYGVLLGGAASGVLAAITVVPLGVPALNPGGGMVDAQIVTLWGFQAAAYAAGPAFDAVLLLSIAVPAAAPSWLRALSGILAALAVVSVFGVSNAAVGTVGLVYSMLFFAWILAGSAWLLTSAPAPSVQEVPAGSA